MQKTLLGILIFASLSVEATTLTILYDDDPGVGFLDPTPVQPVDGNAALTLGEQRKASFEYTVDHFERMVWISDTISPRIRANFKIDPERNPSTIGLARATAPSPDRIPAEVPGIQPNTLYNDLLYARLSGTLAPPTIQGETHEGEVQFSDGYNFDLSIPIDPMGGKQLVSTAMHEFIHLSGFGTDLPAFNFDIKRPLGVFTRLVVHEGATPRRVPEMTNEQVKTLLEDPDGARFSGSNGTKTAAANLLTMGQNDGEIFLSQDTIHMSNTVFPRTVMHPGSANRIDIPVIAYMLSDLGWGPVSDTSVTIASDDRGIAVTTNSDQTNQDVVTSIRIPDGLTISSVNGDPANCATNEQTITCRYASLPANTPQTVAVDLSGQVGRFEIKADTDHQDFHVDPIATNNFVTQMFESGSNPFSGLVLSNNRVAGNAEAGTTIGSVTASLTDSTVSPNPTFTLLGGDGSDDNTNFTLSPAGALSLAVALDQELGESQNIRIRASAENGFTREETFAIQVSGNPIDSVSLNATAVAGDAPANTRIGTFTTQTTEPDLTFSYRLATGEGDTNNGAVKIVDNQLQVASSLNETARTIFRVLVETTASNGYSKQKVFQIRVNPPGTGDCVSSAPSLLPFNQAIASTTNGNTAAIWPIQLSLILALLLLMRLVRRSTLNRKLKWSLVAILSLGLMACGGGGGGGSPC